MTPPLGNIDIADRVAMHGGIGREPLRESTHVWLNGSRPQSLKTDSVAAFEVHGDR